MDKFSIRDVSLREVYDSYMGILRISPNDSEDDPQSLIESLVSVPAGENIKLSDSQGDILPIEFSAFTEKLTWKSQDNTDVVQIQTNVNNLFYTVEQFNVRGMLQIEDNEKKYPIAIKSKTSSGSFNTLYFPRDCPYDSKYWNDKQKVRRSIDPDPHPTYSNEEWVKAAQNEQSSEWWNTHLEDSQRVRVNGKLIYKINNDGESVVIPYDRTYALGHQKYDTFSDTDTSVLNDIKASDSVDLGKRNTTTLLSWIRIDELTWNAISQYANGKFRHYKGRYDELGAIYDSSGNPEYQTSIVKKLFESDTLSDTIKQNAPLIGQSLQKGLVFYNAMPFHRYWFYVQKQIQTNKKIRQGDSYKNLTPYTPFKDFDTSNICSIAKNFAICNGLKFSEYNNINLRDSDVYDKKYNLITPEKTLNWYQAVCKSTNSKTPCLTNPEQDSPVFIRSANWQKEEDSDGNVTYSHNDKIILLKVRGDSSSISEQTSLQYKQDIINGDDKLIELKRESYDFNSVQRHRHYLFNAYGSTPIEQNDIWYKWYGLSLPTVNVSTLQSSNKTLDGESKSAFNSFIKNENKSLIIRGGRVVPIGARLIPYDDSSTYYIYNNSNTATQIELDGGKTFKNLKKLDEYEGSIPITLSGGLNFKYQWSYTYWAYVKRSRVRGKWGNKMKWIQLGSSVYTDKMGQYRLASATEDATGTGSYRLLTSYNYDNRDLLRNESTLATYIDSDIYETSLKYGKEEVDKICTYKPYPFTLSLIPLLSV